MRGKSHIAMGVTSGIIVADTMHWLIKSTPPDWLFTATMAVKNFLIPSDGLPIYFFLPIAIILYLLGCVLPDIDHQYSMIGKIIHIPVAHRTWTHALWWPILCWVIGIWYRPVFWLGLGIFVHDFWDFFSASGIHWFYPIKQKGKHVLKLYHTSKMSEFVVVGVSVGITIIYTLVMIQCVYQILNIQVSF
ncbi:metal-dependent hydrolase [bacterium]|nr:metal-dependent hydrolase [bacterium]